MPKIREATPADCTWLPRVAANRSKRVREVDVTTPVMENSRGIHRPRDTLLPECKHVNGDEQLIILLVFRDGKLLVREHFEPLLLVEKATSTLYCRTTNSTCLIRTVAPVPLRRTWYESALAVRRLRSTHFGATNGANYGY